MKETLLLFGLAGIIILIAALVDKWGTTQKLKGIAGKVGHLDISFWWRLTAVLLAIGVTIALWPVIITVPWEKSRTATILGGLLLLGLLIQWARQGEKKKEGSLLAVVGVALLIAAGLWGLWWVYREANRPPESYAVERVVVQPPAPVTPEFIFTNEYGLALGQTFKVFSTKAGETNGPFVVTKPGKISWGTFTPDNLVVFRDGVLMNTKQHFTNEGPNLIGNFTFTAKEGAVEYWVATGLSHRVSN